MSPLKFLLLYSLAGGQKGVYAEPTEPTTNYFIA